MQLLHPIWFTFVDICRLRVAPQDLPASSGLLKLVLIVYALINVVLLLAQQLSLQKSVLTALAETGLLILITATLLRATHFYARLTQTLTALAGAEIILNIVGIPIVIWFQMQVEQKVLGVSLLLLLMLMIWSLIVHAHIFRHALEISFFKSLILAIIVFFLTANILFLLFPIPE